MKCMEKQERTTYWNFQKGKHTSFSSDSVNAVLWQWLKKTIFYKSGWGRGFAVVGFRVRRSYIWVVCLCVCVCIEGAGEGECLSLWRIIIYLLTKLHICYMIRVAISEARNDHGAVFTILGCSSSGMKLILGDAKCNKTGMDELWSSEHSINNSE